MGYSKGTRYYNLPQFQPNDSAKWTSDINEAFATIDEVMHTNEGNSGGGDVYERIDALELANTSVSTELNKLKNNDTLLDGEIAGIQSRLTSVSEKADTASEQVTSINRRIEEVNSTLSGVESNLVSYNSRIGNVETKTSQNAQDITANYNRLMGEISSTDDNVASLTEAHQELNTALAQMVQKYNTNSGSTASGLTGFGESVGSNIRVLNTNINSSNQQSLKNWTDYLYGYKVTSGLIPSGTAFPGNVSELGESIGKQILGNKNNINTLAQELAKKADSEALNLTDNRVTALEKNWNDSNVGSLTEQVNTNSEKIRTTDIAVKNLITDVTTAKSNINTNTNKIGAVETQYANLEADFTQETNYIYEQINSIRPSVVQNITMENSYFTDIMITETPFNIGKSHLLRIEGCIRSLKQVPAQVTVFSFTASTEYVYPSTVPIKYVTNGEWKEAEVQIIKNNTTGKVQVNLQGVSNGWSTLAVNSWLIFNLSFIR